MATSYFVKNNTSIDVKEFKPGIGTFLIPPGKELEIHDVLDVMKTPIKTEVEYVRFSAEQVAKALVNDFGRPGLEVVVKGVAPHAAAPTPQKSLADVEKERKAKALDAAVKREDAKEDRKEDK